MESVESYWAKIPPIVREFIPKYIKSATALEILLILQSTPEEEWRLSEISGALELDRTVATDRMEELKSAGLVSDRSLAYEHFYQYTPPPMKSSWRSLEWRKRIRCIPLKQSD